MSVKTSVSMSEQQDAFVRRLVEEGRFSSASAVIQHSIEILRQQKETEEDEMKAIRAFFAERAKGPFLTEEESDAHIAEIIERKRREYGV